MKLRNGLKVLEVLLAILIVMPFNSAGATVSITESSTAASSPASIGLEAVTTVSGYPVGINHAADGSGRLFITLKSGSIVIFDGELLLSTPFLTVTGVATGFEQGLLGVAFHPQYSSNGLFYVNYTDSAGDTVIAQYSVSADANIADPASAAVLLTISQPDTNHNGGQLQFGPDGYLYIGMGDGGGGGDVDDHAQNPDDPLGKMLRIDVENNNTGDGLPYDIPSDNPFVGDPDTLDEIWALGLRNPWRFSFDRLTGDLFIADVGQGAWEEVDFQPASSSGGENYGWRCYEGSHEYNLLDCLDAGAYEFPILEYGHTSGNGSITGGYRYRGSQYPALYGTYLYADWSSGRIWGAVEDGPGLWTATELRDEAFNITSFGEDEAGELYLAASNGVIYRIVNPNVVPAPADFDSDETSDVVIFRSGAWRFFDFVSASFDQGVWTGSSPGCLPVAMDYDGDGGDEYTQFCDGAWHFYNDDGSYNKGIWTGGMADDLPVPADYDGDGVEDVVVWRAGAWRFFDFDTAAFDYGVWTGSPPHWLGGTNIPAPMDYDGDGAAEFTVFAGGPWHFFNDDGTYNKGIWTGGVAGDMPVPADYDGDGTEEVVISRSGAWRFFDFITASFTNGVWTGFPPHGLGGTSLPAPLDYDGDGAVEFAVFAGGPWHFYNADGSYNKGIWTGGVSADLPLSRRLLP